MTIDFTAPYATTSLFHSQPNFIPTKIPVQHHQLKHFISTRNGDFVYYAANYDVFSIHIPSSKRRLVKSLKWKPMCLDAASDWICVGGQHKGQCAFIEVRRATGTGPVSSLPLEVDDLVPLDLNPESRAVLHRPHVRAPDYVTHEHEIGEDIVNSVVIHHLVGGKPDLEDQTVAILTNNDKTVRLFSLSNQDILDSPEEYPTSMNHASISPDGKLLLAVGDEPQAFFHQRVFREITRKGRPAWDWTWQEVCCPKLSLVHADDCCFATGFSPSGHICAVASQTGIITIFNTALICADMESDLPVVGTLKSSRSNISTCRGAIRALSFSPSPWDLLALAEDQGRVTVLDLRNGLQSIQTLFLETSSKEVVRLDIHDETVPFDQRQLDLERHFLESHDDALTARDYLAAVANTADYMEFAADQRRRDRSAIEVPPPPPLQSSRGAGDPHHLTENERLLIDAISARRSRESNTSSENPTTTNYPSGSNRFIPGTPSWDSINSWSNVPSRHTASIAEYMRLRNSDRSRSNGERSINPRRRSSVVVSQLSTNASSSSNPSSTLAPSMARPSTFSASPSRLPQSSTLDRSHPSAEEPWQTITAAMRDRGDIQARMRRLDATLASVREREARSQAIETESAMGQSPIPTLRQLESRNERQREINQLNAQRLSILRAQQRSVDEDDLDDSSASYLARVDSADGVTTMGVGWSVDGRALFVATEEGIFEYKINTAERGRFPGMSWN